MRVRIRGKILRVVSATLKEIKWFKKKLSWENKFQSKIDGVTPCEELWFEDKEGLYTFTGLLELLQRECSFAIEVENPTPLPKITPMAVRDDILTPEEDPSGFQKLAEHQVAAIRKALMLKRGLVTMPTGAGKSEFLLGLIAHIWMYQRELGTEVSSVFVVVPSEGLATQLRSRAILRGFDPDCIGLYYGKEKTLGRKITIAVVNSVNLAIKNDNLKVLESLNGSDVVVFDECHHLRASSWLEIATLCGESAEYLIGMSGSPYHSDNVLENSGDALITGLVGSPIFIETYEHLIEIGFIPQPVVYFQPVGSGFRKFGRYNTVYDQYVVGNQARNIFILAHLQQFVRWGFQVLILVQRKEHAKALLLGASGMSGVCVFGGGEVVSLNAAGGFEESRCDLDKFAREFPASGLQFIIGTQALDEGIDLPSVGAVIMGGGGKSRIKGLQRLGRGLRRRRLGLNQVYILEFFDADHVFLSSQSKKRAEIYEQAGAYFAKSSAEFYSMFSAHGEDLINEQREITERRVDP